MTSQKLQRCVNAKQPRMTRIPRISRIWGAVAKCGALRLEAAKCIRIAYCGTSSQPAGSVGPLAPPIRTLLFTVPNHGCAVCGPEQQIIRVAISVKVCSANDGPSSGNSRSGYRPIADIVAQVPDTCCTCILVEQQIVGIPVAVEICKPCHMPAWREAGTRIPCNSHIVVQVPNHRGEAARIEQQIV